MTTLSYRLVESIGSEAVVAPAHLRDYSVDGVVPDVAVLPRNVEAVSEVLSFATWERRAVTPWGGGTQMALGNSPRAVDVVVGLGSLDRVLFHEPEDLVTSVEAGITLGKLQSQLARKGQFLPLEAPLRSMATIGGILAANTNGPSRLAHGTARDWLIGIKVVQADGVVTKSGGRVVKNVTGYDLNKLYIGSLGTLGVVVEATFKVAPLPPDRRTLIADYPSVSAAMDSAGELVLQGYAPQALQVVNRQVMESVPNFRISGGAEAAVLALFAGRNTAVNRVADEWAKVFGNGAAIAVESLRWEEGDALWQALLDLEWAQQERPQVAVKVTTPPSRLREYLEMVASPSVRPFTGGLVADMGLGQARLLWWDLPEVGEGVQRLISSLRKTAVPYGGNVVVERCPRGVKANLDVWGEPVQGLAIMRRLKREFDPAAILNSGRFAGGI